MIERELRLNGSGKNRTLIWKMLPKKVMWTTFTTVLDYLEYSRKIHIGKDKTVTWLADLDKPKDNKRNGMVIV